MPSKVILNKPIGKICPQAHLQATPLLSCAHTCCLHPLCQLTFCICRLTDIPLSVMISVNIISAVCTFTPSKQLKTCIIDTKAHKSRCHRHRNKAASVYFRSYHIPFLCSVIFSCPADKCCRPGNTHNTHRSSICPDIIMRKPYAAHPVTTKHNTYKHTSKH